MNVSIWVVVLLVLLSGAVAAVGDWLGRRLGKKRLRIGRLRPKHTAILTTAIAGMLITLVTILVLSLVSEQVRVWLTEGTDVQRQLREARDELGSTKSDLAQSKRDVSATNQQLADQKARLEEEQKKLADATAEAAKMRADAADLRVQVAALGEKIRKASADLEKVQGDLTITEEELQRRLTNIDEYIRQQEELQRENLRLIEANDKLENDVGRLTTQISELNQQVSDATAAQEQATRNFKEEIDRINEERTRAQTDLNTANADLKRINNELTLAQNRLLLAVDYAQRSRLNRLIYNRGDELSRLAVRSGLTQVEARGLLLGAIELASRDAIARGAREAEGGAATFQGMNNVSAEAQFNQALQALVAKGSEQLIVVRSVFNAFKDDTIAIDVDVVPNKVVYSLGDFIIETRIDGRLGVQGATEALIGFMSNQLRQRAVGDGMVPAIGRMTELGAISQEEVQRIVGDIVATGRTITVRFHAAKETKAGDQLVLDIRLR